MKISFCTTCKGRLWQLSQTYVQNIEQALFEHDEVEFVLVNYWSPDDLDVWVSKTLEWASELITYVRLENPLPWHVCKAKNMAHSAATGDVLCNLDADNFLGEGYVTRVTREVHQGLASRLVGCHSNGGRIAVHRDDFFSIGGYDEGLAPMGGEDHDLEARLRAYGVKVLHWKHGPLPIANSNEQRAEFCDMPFERCSRISHDISAANLAAGKIVANT